MADERWPMAGVTPYFYFLFSTFYFLFSTSRLVTPDSRLGSDGRWPALLPFFYFLLSIFYLPTRVSRLPTGKRWPLGDGPSDLHDFRLIVFLLSQTKN